MKEKIFKIITVREDEQGSSWVFDIFLSTLILLNVFAVIFESYPEFGIEYKALFYYFEIFSIIIFSIEYVLRIWTADIYYPSLSPVKSRFKYLFSVYGFIDLISVVPFYLPMLIIIDMRYLKVLRLMRLFRIFKLSRHSKSFNIIASVLRETKYDLFVTLFVAAVLMLVSALLVYSVEHEAQPEKFRNIGDAIWWASETLTTVGYGDLYPITTLGRIISAFVSVLGMGLVALPTGIISSTLISKINKGKNRNKNEDGDDVYKGKFNL